MCTIIVSLHNENQTKTKLIWWLIPLIMGSHVIMQIAFFWGGFPRGGGGEGGEFCLLKQKQRVVDIGVFLPHKTSFQTFWFISHTHAMVLIWT